MFVRSSGYTAFIYGQISNVITCMDSSSIGGVKKYDRLGIRLQKKFFSIKTVFECVCLSHMCVCLSFPYVCLSVCPMCVYPIVFLTIIPPTPKGRAKGRRRRPICELIVQPYQYDHCLANHNSPLRWCFSA